MPANSHLVKLPAGRRRDEHRGAVPVELADLVKDVHCGTGQGVSGGRHQRPQLTGRSQQRKASGNTHLDHLTSRTRRDHDLCACCAECWHTSRCSPKCHEQRSWSRREPETSARTRESADEPMQRLRPHSHRGSGTCSSGACSKTAVVGMVAQLELPTVLRSPLRRHRPALSIDTCMYIVHVLGIPS